MGGICYAMANGWNGMGWTSGTSWCLGFRRGKAQLHQLRVFAFWSFMTNSSLYLMLLALLCLPRRSGRRYIVVVDLSVTPTTEKQVIQKKNDEIWSIHAVQFISFVKFHISHFPSPPSLPPSNLHSSTSTTSSDRPNRSHPTFPSSGLAPSTLPSFSLFPLHSHRPRFRAASQHALARSRWARERAGRRRAGGRSRRGCICLALEAWEIRPGGESILGGCSSTFL